MFGATLFLSNSIYCLTKLSSFIFTFKFVGFNKEINYGF